MSSESTNKNSRSLQSRINGAHSQGPTSIDGKARSSKNALKHGFAAAINVVLSIEDADAFNEHTAKFSARFNPQDYVEQSMVDQLASINWRQARLVALETSLIDAQTSIQHNNVNKRHPAAVNDP